MSVRFKKNERVLSEDEATQMRKAEIEMVQEVIKELPKTFRAEMKKAKSDLKMLKESPLQMMAVWQHKVEPGDEGYEEAAEEPYPDVFLRD